VIHNIAHRGASAYEPENTLRAFERAIEMGATMLELDVHLSREGHPMVIHDTDLSRTTNGTGRVTDLSLTQIKRFDAGLGEQVPTLDEVIELARDRAKLYIDLKGQSAPEQVVKTLQKADFLDQVIVGSFYPWLPQKVKFLEPGVRTSVLIRLEDRRADFVAWTLAVGADYVHPCWESGSTTPHKLLTPGIIANFRQHGLGILLWHEERPAELHQLVKLDVDGICTDKPDLLSRIIRKEQEKTEI